MRFEFCNHLGTPILLGLVALGALAGFSDRWLAGAALMLAVYGLLWLMGAYCK